MRSPLQATTLAAPRITVDGATVGVPAVQRNSAVFVPVRGVFEKLGADVSYKPPGSILARKDGRDLARMTVGSRAATVNGSSATLSAAPFASQGHVMVPLRLISEAAGATVAYVASPRSVQITRRTAAAIAPVAQPVASAAPVAEERHGFPWWLWPLLALALLALILMLMRRRKEPIIRTTSSVPTGVTKIKTRR
ncbi:MAG: copper amine oxidase N-terminal domain-containing protein [Candidatus Eremiobacteraeota bacterium]|nr:copper amine oxidase N-terminal domain-containing protein [Candidatus Eremiobacteraeota bacterium]